MDIPGQYRHKRQSSSAPEANWAGNYRYRARAIHRPATLEQLRELLSGGRRMRVLGSRHSFSDIADSDELVSLERIERGTVVDRSAMTVSLGGATTYGELAGELGHQQLALANLSSLPHIAVAGAISTATHGSGDGNGNLATAAVALELVTSDGELLRSSRGDPDFAGLVVGLGGAGAVVGVTLAVEPFYEVRQRVFEGLPWDALYEHFDEIFASGYSVSAFTRWGESVDQVWVKARMGTGTEEVPDELFGAPAATEDRHPIIGLDPIHATPQLGLPGPWSERLPHFRMGFTPSSGEELQSEYLVARRHAVAAIEAVRRLGTMLEPLTQVSEIRTVAADRLWMSPEYGRESAGIHFTWKPRPRAVRAALEEIERALVPFEPRPHWGKLFLADAAAIAPLYERRRDFVALLERLDPRGAFRNRWLERCVLGP
jgi:xylitol oxidase